MLVASVSGFAQTGGDKYRALGMTMEAQLESHYGPFVNPPVVERKSRVLRTLTPDPLTLKLIDDRAEALSSAFPGGVLLVTSAAIARATDEADLAAILAHALGHLQAARSAPGPVKPGSNIPLIFAGGEWGYCHRADSGGSMIEAEADRWAAQYMTAAGYDPSALKTVFQRRMNPPTLFH